MLLYAVTKFVVYILWCLLGQYLFTRPSFGGAIAYGAVRWILGFVFGVGAALALGSVSQENVTELYFGIYIPLRVIEWSIMVCLIGNFKTLRANPKAWLWILGGIAVSFASDFMSPDGMEGRFCVGRCLC
ncbi:MAG: hypothetical protein LBB59_02245 [Campylobacteraceae bacterium]|jgi:hypothetical protein|nr:hypothetical protein [Campylobacteraceae bacterium]